MLHLNASVFPLKCSVSPNKVSKLLDKNVQVVCIKVNMVLIQQKRASIRLYYG